MSNHEQSKEQNTHLQTSLLHKIDWTKKLFDYHVPIDAELFAKWDRKIEIQGKEVLEKDLPRTRCKEPQMKKQGFKDVLRRMAAFYCQQNGVSYQQGMLEVVYPFALLRRKQFPTKKCYAYFNAFMRKHIPKVLTMKLIQKKKQLPHTVFAIALTEYLLRFHYPLIYSIFKSEEIYLSMVITQELMTVFSKNTEIQLVFEIFDYFIKKNNPHHIFHMCVALIGMKEKEIAEAAEQGSIHMVVREIKSVKSKQDLIEWFKFSERIEKNTPKTFDKTCNQFGFSHRNILSYQQLQNMISSQKFFPGGFLSIEISQIEENPQKYIFISVENRITHSKQKYKTFTIAQLKKQGNQLQNKIYVLAMREQKKESDSELLIETANEVLKEYPVVILREEFIEKKEKCVIC